MKKQPKVLYMTKSDLYDRILMDFPYAVKMFSMMKDEVKKLSVDKDGMEVLDFGFGTGLLTEKIANLKGVGKITGVDPSQDFLPKAKARLAKYDMKLIKKDVCLYQHRHPVDVIVASFTYHHVPDNKKQKFITSIARNLKKGGVVVIGDEFLPPFKGEKEKAASIMEFYTLFTKYLVSKNANKETIDIFKESLKESLSGIEEYKTSLAVFKKQLKRASFKIKKVTPVWPIKGFKEWGCKIILATK